jgi:hypothetical protein
MRDCSACDEEPSLVCHSTHLYGKRVNRPSATSVWFDNFLEPVSGLSANRPVQADSVIVSVMSIYLQRHLAPRLLWGKGITARRFLHASRIQANGVATIFFISGEQRVPSGLQVANKQPLVVLFTAPELDSGVKHLHPPQHISAYLIDCDDIAVFAVALG